MKMKVLAMTVFLLMAACAPAQTTQVNDSGVTVVRLTDHIPNYEIALMDQLGAFGPAQSVSSPLVPARDCVPIQVDGVYAISARGLWSVDGTMGVREFSIRLKRNGVWTVIAEDKEPKVGKFGLSSEEHTVQTVTMIDALSAGDCVGTFAHFNSRNKVITFGAISLLVSLLP